MADLQESVLVRAGEALVKLGHGGGELRCGRREVQCGRDEHWRRWLGQRRCDVVALAWEAALWWRGEL